MLDISQCTVLIVDDNRSNIDVISNALEGICEVSAALDGNSALKLIEKSTPDLLLLDIMMPDMDGFEVCRRLGEHTLARSIPIMFLTGMAEIEDKLKGFSCGAVDYIVKPFEPVEVIARVKTHLLLAMAKKELERQNDELERKVLLRTRELALTQDVTIETMAALVEYRDPETGGHIQRTKLFVKTLAETLRKDPLYADAFTDEVIGMMTKSAPLHDVGKVGIPDHILLKPGKLTFEEFEIMKRHTTIGYTTLLRAEKKLGYNSFLTYAREIAHSHHEKWDGSGYPRGLSGDNIPVSGRLMALADVYDALISKRVYKAPMPHKTAVGIILEGKGKHFDPLMVDAFEAIEDRMRNIALTFADFDEEREMLEKG